MEKIFVTIVLFLVIENVFGGCGTCGRNSGVVCRDSTTFSFCRSDNDVDEMRLTCPVGTFCGDDFRICAVEPMEACNPICGKCNGRFACLSESTYALCFGQGYPSGHVFTCPDNLSCSTQKNGTSVQQFCFDATYVSTDKIDCYKDIVVEINDYNGGMVLLPPMNPGGIQ